MSSVDRPVRRAIYLAVLSASDPSPLLRRPATSRAQRPATNHAANPRRGRRVRRPSMVGIDFDGSDSESWPSMFRPAITAASPPARRGRSFIWNRITPGGGPASLARAVPIQGARRALPRRHPLLHALGGQEEAALSGRRKSLGNRCDRPPPKVGDGAINVAQIETQVDPRAEWAQIYRETWRIQREYFYDAKHARPDWQAIYEEVSASPRLCGPPS